MFYHLLYPLRDIVSGFNLFRYITFRAAYAVVTALVISIWFGPGIIAMLKRRQIGEKIRAEGPKSHYAKAGTPTMGGLIVLLATLVPTLLWADLTNRYIQLIVVVTAGMGLIGFIDDYYKAVRKQPKGLVAKKKLLGQLVLGLALGIVLYTWPPSPEFTTSTDVPFFKTLALPLGIFFIPFVLLVVAATSNAVNLTDGLDGLAIGLSAIAFLAFAAICYITGRSDFSRYLAITYLPGAGELTIYCAAAMGAALGFLWFNAHPAEVFMGDTGALALGGAIGALAIMTKKEILLLILGGVFAAEALSVILQVGYFRYTGRRIFRMAPLHHHFELLGWPESKVVVRFWIIGAICALLTLSTLKIR
ncbi:MAG: phospho-N-acetylmuramoyl-pentapeptide-transferase [candidate division Zixibacteria bacterium]|nr:phospho-N-acetylmuramoyl-pentapeptide-transferase [candidate division Zixibacteria bacterium]